VGVKVQNFQSKSERKKYRKGLVQGYIANKAVEVREGVTSRAEFYRTLRVKKQNRHRVAAELLRLGPEINELRVAVERFHQRCSYTDSDYVESAVRLLNKAQRTAEENAYEYRQFAYQRIYYRKDAVPA
jgi:hypothetical protein